MSPADRGVPLAAAAPSRKRLRLLQISRQWAADELSGSSHPGWSPVGALLLLVVVGMGAAARHALPGRPAHSGDGSVTAVTLVAVALAAVGVVGGFALLLHGRQMRRRRRREMEQVKEISVSRGARAAGLALVLAALVTPLVVGYAVLPLHPTAQQPQPLPTRSAVSARSPAASTAGRPRSSTSGSPVEVVILVAVVLLTSAGMAFLLRRPQPAGTSPTKPLRDGSLTPLRLEETLPLRLEETVPSGSSAMTEIGDARRAIIARYTAMEAGLAGAGLPRGPAQTPTELLEAASSTGLVSRGAAAELTGLFATARFSDNPMTGADLHNAERALATLQSDVAARS